MMAAAELAAQRGLRRTSLARPAWVGGGAMGGETKAPALFDEARSTAGQYSTSSSRPRRHRIGAIQPAPHVTGAPRACGCKRGSATPAKPPDWTKKTAKIKGKIQEKFEPFAHS